MLVLIGVGETPVTAAASFMTATSPCCKNAYEGSTEIELTGTIPTSCRYIA